MSTPILRRKVGETEYQDFLLDKPTCTVGRSRECDITINDTSLSRLHFRLVDRDGSWFLVDNNSSNGTFLNRRKVREAPVLHGDDLIAGRVHFSFQNLENDGGSVTKPMPTIGSVSETVSANLHDMVSDDDLTPPPMSMGPSVPPMSTGPSVPPMPPKAPPMAPPAPMAPPPPLSRTPASMAETTELVTAETADPLQRLLAVLIDAGVGLALGIPGILLGLLGLSTLSLIAQFLGMLAGMAHLIVGWLKYRKTIGKHVMKLYIEELDDPNGSELPPKVVVMRLLGSFLCAVPCLLGYLTILIDPGKRGFHDKLAGTRVVREQS